MAEARLRIVTALVLMPAAVAAVWLLPPPWFALCSGVLFAIAGWEWAALAGLQTPLPRLAYVVLLACLLLLLNPLAATTVQGQVFITIGIICWLLVAALVGLAAAGHSWPGLRQRSARVIIGVLVLAPSWWALISLQRVPESGPRLALFLLILVWIDDTLAFCAGRRWGRTRLCPRISPGKTWFGLAAGLFGVAVGGLLLGWLQHMDGREMTLFLLICVVTGVAVVAGDLLESLMKRSADLKDSGRLLPGHGGILDRIDGLLAAAPVFLAGVALTRGLS